MNRPVVITAATKHSVKTISDIRGAIGGGVDFIPRKTVLTPFPHVAAHVVNAKLIWPFPSDFMRLIAAVTFVPRNRVDVIAAAEVKIIGPMYSASRGVFPFGFGRESKYNVCFSCY